MNKIIKINNFKKIIQTIILFLIKFRGKKISQNYIYNLIFKN